MLSTAQMTAILDEVTYRPDWVFEVYETEFEGPHILIVAPVENTYQPGTTLDIGVRSPLPPFETEREFLRWLSWRLRRIEIHESMEYLRHKGSLVFDPHEGDEKTDDRDLVEAAERLFATLDEHGAGSSAWAVASARLRLALRQRKGT